MTTILHTTNLTGGYGKSEVLHEININVEEGEILSLIGPNGAGKSTLFKTICGILKPFKGSVIYKSKEIVGSKPEAIIRDGIGFLPQEGNIFPNLTVYENLKVSANLVERFDEKLKDVYDLFPLLKERIHQKAGTLSGGERRMLALGNALILDTKLLLLDEPCGGLAPKLLSDFRDKIVSINREEGKTLFWAVGENLEHILKISDRCYILLAGNIIFGGESKEVLEKDLLRKKLFA